MRNIAILLLLFGILAGCDLFRVRDSETPTKPAPWNSYATTWDLCLQNLEYCYGDSRNAVKYLGLFTTDFSFRFADQDINDYNLAPTWTAVQEQDMLINLHNLSDSIRVELDLIPELTDLIGPSEVTIYRQYQIWRYFLPDAQPEFYKGNMELQLRKSGAYWYIYRWFDYRTSSSDPTWGKMKNDFSQ